MHAHGYAPSVATEESPVVAQRQHACDGLQCRARCSLLRRAEARAEKGWEKGVTVMMDLSGMVGCGIIVLHLTVRMLLLWSTLRDRLLPSAEAFSRRSPLAY